VVWVCLCVFLTRNQCAAAIFSVIRVLLPLKILNNGKIGGGGGGRYIIEHKICFVFCSTSV